MKDLSEYYKLRELGKMSYNRLELKNLDYIYIVSYDFSGEKRMQIFPTVEDANNFSDSVKSMCSSVTTSRYQFRGYYSNEKNTFFLDHPEKHPT